jgi:hypothetical protein
VTKDAEVGLGLVASAAASRKATSIELDDYGGDVPATTVRGARNIDGMVNHIVICGAAENELSFFKLILMLRRCGIAGVTLRARWVTLRARWVTLRARWVTLRARWVTLRARWVTLGLGPSAVGRRGAVNLKTPPEFGGFQV